MSADNNLEMDVLRMVAKGVDPAFRAAANGYWALFTADPTETASLTNECNDASYARVAQVKATAWTEGSGEVSNAALVQWPQLAGSGSDLTHFAWVSSASGAVTYMLSNALTTPIPWSPGIRPQADIGQLKLNAQ